MNRYHANLKLPVPFTFPSYPVPDMQLHYHARFHKSDMNEEFKQWIYSKGVAIATGEFFYTPPNRTLEPHGDGGQICDFVKLNWMKGGEGSVMDWYELKPGANLKHNSTVIGTQYSFASGSDLIRVHSAPIGSPSLVNVGRVHGIRNGNQPRYVACVILHWPNTGQRLNWDEAQEVFEQYIV